MRYAGNISGIVCFRKGLGRSCDDQITRVDFAQETVDLISEISPDRYGRVLSELRMSGVNVADILIAEGLARPHSGGTRFSWC